MARAGEEEQTRDRERETDDLVASIEDDFDVEGVGDAGADPDDPGAATGTEASSLRDRLRGRAGRLFSPRAFLVATALATAGFLLVATLLPFGSIAGLAGVAAGAFLYGVSSDTRRYTEATAAGAAVAGVGLLLDYLALSVVAGAGAPVTVFGVGAGAVAALVGHYFGRDLRAGLTQSL